MPDVFAVCLAYSVAAALLGASVVALAQLGRRFGLDEWRASALGFVGVGCAGYLAFLVYLLSVPAGIVLSLACLALLIVASLARHLRGGEAAPRELTRALVLAGLFGLTYLTLLFWYVPKYSADVPSEIFFEWPRAHDQKIPMMFAEAIYQRLPSRTGKDLWGWYFSDRPPLQAGFVLLFSPLWNIADRAIVYQAVGTALQASCIAALWIMLRALGFRYRETLLAVVTTGASGFVYFHSVYVWPKLLAATFVLIAMVPLTRAFLARERLDAGTAAIAAAAAALAMLAHGGAVYTLVPLAILLATRLTSLIEIRSGAIAAAVIVALYGPWAAYAQMVDPNQSRLFKEHLADGQIHESETLWQALARSYRGFTPGQWVGARIQNLQRQFGDARVDRAMVAIARGIRDERLRLPWAFEPWPGVAADKLRYDLVSLGSLLRVDQREFLLRTLGPLNVAWPVLILLYLRRRKGGRGLDPPLSFLLLLNLLTLPLWSIAQFSGGSAVNTHASLAMVLIAIASAVLILARTSPFWACAICVANGALSFVIWVLLAPGAYWSEPRRNLAVLLSAAVATGLFVLVRSWFRAGPDNRPTLSYL